MTTTAVPFLVSKYISPPISLLNPFINSIPTEFNSLPATTGFIPMPLSWTGHRFIDDQRYRNGVGHSIHLGSSTTIKLNNATFPMNSTAIVQCITSKFER
jgi:hypothetical protein